MPKKIDHEQRRKQIAEATWRMILERGMEGATVRNIAQEAGLSLGALRHYFSTQDELLRYAMTLVKEKATARIQEVAMKDLPPKEKAVQLMLEIIPTDEETLAEMEVWFAFTAYARHKGEEFNAQHDGIHSYIYKLIDWLDENKLLKTHLDKETEAEKLYAIVDGLALHAMLDPERLVKDKVSRVLVHHVDSLCIDQQ
ncbi:TetR/AcrR family transcriptional regulator [Bacillus nakamurai]|uniref:TetR/AcrR family transcriptional regulator n=1 Tax=Bacillus nakamurai TaxID=1793963 RepID=UPI0020C3CE4F|nr:TetR/AcrR family transcriptional regulator [Bacillus nakamurai]MCP6682374.1 TetR/AcrR family transcriptional regulator [Bacillus nakamurai]